MLKPSLWLSLLAAIVAADLSTSNANASNGIRNSSCQSLPVMNEELTEEQRINEEARRSLGNELLRL